ncbi:MAG: DUF4340 domain-containing protein [Syntrophobacterales bacterium]
MTPRRLLPLLAVFLVLAAAYFLLTWHQSKEAREKEEAKQLFTVKETEISSITLKRPTEEIRLVKEGKDWRLVQPLKEQADKVTLSSLVSALSHLRLTRDLGPEKDVTPFGLAHPILVISFTAGDKSHTLSVGKKVPGGQGYYVRRDQDPGVLIIPSSSKESLDRRLSDLRNRSLFDFTVEKVKALRVKTPKTQVTLEKKGGRWRWVGKENFKIYPARLERLLRFVSLARVKEFVPDATKNLKAYGLAPPALAITVVTEQGEQSLWLGSRKKDECYARQGDQGPVILMENLILDLFTSPLESVATLRKNPLWGQVQGVFPQYLEDHRLWTGEVKNVATFTWGPPGGTWTAAKDKDFYKLTGPDKQEVRQPAIRVELALLKLQDLETEGQGTAGASETKAKYSLELRDKSGQTIFRLEELGRSKGQVKVRYATHKQASRETMVAKKAFEQWQGEMKQLTTPPPAK